MVVYLANRIIAGALIYDTVVTKRPDLKEKIDQYLINAGRSELITA